MSIQVGKDTFSDINQLIFSLDLNHKILTENPELFIKHNFKKSLIFIHKKGLIIHA